jgi:hypothetical protein
MVNSASRRARAEGARLLPRVGPAGGDAQYPAHGGERMGGPVGFHELESLAGIDVVSLVRIPRHPDHSFRRIVITHSARS